MRKKMEMATRMNDVAAGMADDIKNGSGSIVAAIAPAANGSTNPAISLSTIISFLFFAKLAIIFLTLRGLTDNF